jgi:hypothetical protein
VPKPEVFLVDWKGKKERIPLKWEIKNRKIHGDEVLGLLQAPWKGTSEWKGQVALVTYGTLRVRIDTQKRTGIIDELRLEDAAVDGKELLQHYAFPRGGIKLRLLLAEKTKSTNPAAQENVHLHLQMVPTGGKKPKLLLEIRNGFSRLSPSPDGKWVAIRSMSDTTRADEILLVSETGQVRKVRGGRKD